MTAWQNQLLFWTALLASWITFFLFFAAPVGFLFWIIALVILFRRRSTLRWFLIACSAWVFFPAFYFVSGTVSYFNGNAKLYSVGYPAPQFYNLENQYRAWNSSSGCIVYGHEFLTHEPNNFSVKFWTGLFGYQRGVYQGVYPTAEAAVKILKETGLEASVHFSGELISIQLPVDTIQITSGPEFDFPEPDSLSQRATAAVVRDELVLLKLSSNPGITYLADKQNGKIFARYFEW